MAARKQTHTEYDQDIGEILVLSVTFKKPQWFLNPLTALFLST